jgi:transketolase
MTRIEPTDIRRIILQQSKRANVGHIGSCLCVVDILCALYGDVLRASSPNDPDRDRMILSKGHAGLALYAVLSRRGWISPSSLDSFCGNDSSFGVHPETIVPGVDFCTGSLGQGLGLAAGAALAARMQGSLRQVYCLLSDAECNEGSTWEAVMFAAHHGLHNLTVIVDVDGQQAFGLTRDVIEMSNLTQRWSAFGWNAQEVDGHSLDMLRLALAPRKGETRPRVLMAHTVFGKGVSYMEKGLANGRKNISDVPFNWHYLPMTDEEYAIALAEQGIPDADAVR